MNIRSAIEEVLYYAGDATLLPCVPVQLEHALSTLRAWLDAQPAAPEPDWTLFDGDDDPPDCFIMSPWGNTLHYFHTDDIDEWWGNMPDMEAVYANSRMIVDVDQSTTLGIDWRTTLRRRPEVTP